MGENDDSKRTLTSLFLSLSKRGVNVEELKERMNDIMRKVRVNSSMYIDSNCCRTIFN